MNNWPWFFFGSGVRLRPNVIALVYRQLAVMIASGCPIDELLTALAAEYGNTRTGRIIQSMHDDLAAGGPEPSPPGIRKRFYNAALLKILRSDTHPEKISRFLYNLADEQENIDTLKGKLVTSFQYPLMILSMAVVLITMTSIFVMPVFEEVFADFHAELPAMTRMVLDLGQLVSRHLVVVLAVVVAVVALLVGFGRQVTTVGAYLPGFRPILVKFAIARFNRYLAMMLAIDIPLSEALRHSALAVGSPYFQNRLARIADRVTSPEQLAAAMAASRFFPDIVTAAMNVGNRHRAMDTMLVETARYFENELGASLHRLFGIMDILAMLILGTIVGIFVIALYLPLFQMANAIV